MESRYSLTVTLYTNENAWGKRKYPAVCLWDVMCVYVTHCADTQSTAAQYNTAQYSTAQHEAKQLTKHNKHSTKQNN